jgi:hypothetical protein
MRATLLPEATLKMGVFQQPVIVYLEGIYNRGPMESIEMWELTFLGFSVYTWLYNFISYSPDPSRWR